MQSTHRHRGTWVVEGRLSVCVTGAALLHPSHQHAEQQGTGPVTGTAAHGARTRRAHAVDTQAQTQTQKDKGTDAGTEHMTVRTDPS